MLQDYTRRCSGIVVGPLGFDLVNSAAMALEKNTNVPYFQGCLDDQRNSVPAAVLADTEIPTQALSQVRLLHGYIPAPTDLKCKVLIMLTRNTRMLFIAAIALPSESHPHLNTASRVAGSGNASELLCCRNVLPQVIELDASSKVRLTELRACALSTPSNLVPLGSSAKRRT